MAQGIQLILRPSRSGKAEEEGRPERWEEGVLSARRNSERQAPGNLSSHASGGQGSKVKLLGGPCSLPRLSRRIPSLLLPAPGGSRRSLGYGHITPICLHLHVALPPSLYLCLL
ncbi:unnamed protein product [Nyctereutes procyonoides]|uniref:(raccoon dog) hypothetical protein n=1 Tax=Nyctereutes procyonoides TaxID=34880 RepID=A0A811XV70_NYCPR|nr:unnamed protein product [Nyctereutes procyonoides]